MGPGLATEGGRAAVRHEFEVVGLERIISVTRADHAAALRVMEKCGLAFREQVVHKGALVVWYAIDRADWQAGQAAAGQYAARRSPALMPVLCGITVRGTHALAGIRTGTKAWR